MPASGHRMLRIWRSLRACQTGTTALEMALLLPTFFTFLVAIEEIGRAVWIQTTLQSAVEVAARCAAIDVTRCSPDVPTYAANQVSAMSVPSTDFTYDGNASCGKQVTATYAFDNLASSLVPLSVTLNAMSCHP